jgi:exopolysaccharide production protein ExoQ
MPSSAAAGVFALFILYLFWSDRKNTKQVSSAIWIPLLWMFFAGSRYLTQWMDLGAPVPFGGVEEYVEGNPINRFTFLGLMAAGAVVLLRRRIRWGRAIAQNPWIWFFFFWGALSIVWSDYPAVSSKRLIKAFGNVIMALVVLSEERPYEAVAVLLRRLSFLFVPLSVLFVKYYPELGRAYSPWNDEPMFTGVAQQKNGLGQICLLAGTYFAWVLVRARDLQFRPPFLVSAILLAMTVWLLHKSNSATSLSCLGLVSLILLASRFPVVRTKPARLIGLGATAIVLIGILEVTVGVSDEVLGILGRDATLTTRTPMWYGLIEMVEHPLIGEGFESFWLGDRLITVWYMVLNTLHQAHNGYLEVYLSLGLIGLGIVLISILSAFFKIYRHLQTEHAPAILRLCFVAAVVLYNWTEATFVGVSNMWIVFFLGAMSLPVRAAALEATRPVQHISPVVVAPNPRPKFAFRDTRGGRQGIL